MEADRAALKEQQQAVGRQAIAGIEAIPGIQAKAEQAKYPTAIAVLNFLPGGASELGKEVKTANKDMEDSLNKLVTVFGGT
jgi:hypothetical protein